MAWVESHQTLLDHRKTLRLASLLRCDRYKVIGHLHALWWWALDNADTFGSLGDVTDLELAIAAGWPEKQAERFARALTEAGWLIVVKDDRTLHDWYDYAGKLSDQRWLRKDSNRKAQQRRRDAIRQQNVSTASSNSQHEKVTDSDSQQPTVPYRTEPPSHEPPYPPADDLEVLTDGLLGHPATPNQLRAVRSLSRKVGVDHTLEVMRHWLKQKVDDPFGAVLKQLGTESKAKPKSTEWAYMDAGA